MHLHELDINEDSFNMALLEYFLTSVTNLSTQIVQEKPKTEI